MQTDAFFHALFSLYPTIVPRVLGIDTASGYTFCSPALKTVERRVDGYFSAHDNEGPVIFLELQGYNDSGLHWRLVAEVGITFAPLPKTPPYVAIVIFLNKRHMVKPPYRLRPPGKLVQMTLEQFVRRLPEGWPGTTVIKPLMAEKRAPIDIRSTRMGQ